MLRVVYGKNFLKSASCLPKEVQKKLAKQINVLQEKLFHPLLHTKYLSGELTGLLSFRITRD
jgi:mRNA-degrading endonuclease RelE of RelBE toxin-antitoxin system